MGPSGYSAHLLRYPYLTDTVTTNATVNWSTDLSQTTGYATYGISGTESCTAHSVSASALKVIIGSTTEYLWNANLPVAADTIYCYRIFLGSGSSAVDLLGSDPAPTFHSQIAAGASTPFTFAVIGDFGAVDSTGTNPDEANLMAQLAASGARFAVSVGDIAYPSGSQANYGDLVQTGLNTSTIFGPQFWTIPGSSLPLMPAVGNHGFARNDTYHPQLTNFPETTAVTTSGGIYTRTNYCCLDGTSSVNDPSAWYAFDVGNTRIYILEAAWSDNNVGTATKYQVDHDYHWTPSSPEYQWLQADLAAHPNQLKFAVFHFPLYSDNATENSDTFLQGAGSLEGLLGSYGVAIAFNGHAHIYQRNNAAPGGLISYVTGAGGASLEPITKCSTIDAYGIGWSYTNNHGSACGAAPKPASPGQVFSFLLVSVSYTNNGSRVTVTPTNSLGQTFDVQTYNFNSHDTTPPTTPTGLTVTGTAASSISLAWNASTDNQGVAGYTVYRDGIAIATTSAVVTSFVDTGLTPSTSYTYTVDAFDAAGNHSAQSSPVYPSTTADGTAPSVPTGLTADVLDASHVALSWNASTDDVGVAGYTVYRNGGVLATVDGATTSYVDATTSPNQSYTYTVDAFDAAGNTSAQSSGVTVTTPSASTPIFSDGFESGDLGLWGSNSGITVESNLVHSGSFAAEAIASGTKAYAKTAFTGTTSIHASIWFNVQSATTQINLFRLRDTTTGSVGYIYVNYSDTNFPGRLGIRDDAGAATYSSQVIPGTGWHHLEFTLTVNGSSSTFETRLDGAIVTDLSGSGNWGTTAIGGFDLGDTSTGTYDVVYDDVELDIPGQ